MAATSQPAPLAGDSFLERLPSELLEKILLEVVGDIIPPAGYRHNDAKPIRCELEGEFGASFASLLLGHRRLRDVDKIWYTTAWSLPTTTEDTSVLELGPVGINAEFERGLKYMVSARFRDFAHQHKSNDLFNFAVVSGVISEAGADLGFRLLMDMMLVAKLQPKCLCLAVTIKEPQYFVTSASSDAAMSIFRQVRELTLIEAGIVPRARSRPNPSISAIAVSRTNFPNLRSLSVELGWFPSSSPIHAILYPRILEVPGLRHISITRGNQMCPRLLNLFELYKGTLQSVSLRDMITVTYEPILKVLKSLSLEALTIHDEYGVWWEGDTYDEREFRGVPKGFLESVAKSGIFGPELLDEKLEDELEVELEEGLEE